MTSAAWQGRAGLWPGVGLFAGLPGDNERHAHQAHQVTLSRDGVVSVECGVGRIEGPGVVIPAGQEHRLHGAGEIVSLYVEPLALGPTRPAWLGAQCSALARSECARLLGAAARLPDPRPLLEAVGGAAFSVLPMSDERWSRVSQALLDGLSDPPERDRLAALACLSPTRFSHWFVERAGLPLRAYRKWLRLQAALAEVAAGRNLTTAAHAAGFADAAHLSRTFRATFGIDPRTALSRLDWGGSAALPRA